MSAAMIAWLLSGTLQVILLRYFCYSHHQPFRSGLITTWSLAAIVPAPSPAEADEIYSVSFTTSGTAPALPQSSQHAAASAASGAVSAGAPHGLSVRLSGMNPVVQSVSGISA
jgi:hypothetical protein